jgi:protein SCO1/2
MGCNLNAAMPDAAAPAVETYEAHGIVRQIAPDRRSVTIQHDAIPGYMSAMTMDFSVKATNVLNGIAPNDLINFQLVVSDDDSWIENVRYVAHLAATATNGMAQTHAVPPDLRPGDLLPDHELTTETGAKIHFSDFRGRVLAFTFFFTRCPLPNYCPRMSQDFAETRKLLLAMPGAPTNWQFLSISFDPEFDQPAVLSAYANSFREDNPDRWLYAVASADTLAALAPKLDLMVRHEDGGITHNLRTVVLGPDGKIARQFDGNKWTPRQLADAMLSAAHWKTNSPSR